MPNESEVRPRDVLAWAYCIALQEDEAARLDAAATKIVRLLSRKLLSDDVPAAGFAPLRGEAAANG